ATGHNLFLVYGDQPGALGSVGTALGAEGINIDAAALSPSEGDEQATLVLRVAQDLDEQLVEKIQGDLNASTAVVLDLN
ncbi:phosphoglycerate dehydrogenase, partial [Enterococcus faecium]